MQTYNFLRALPRYLLSAALVAGITTTVGVYAVDGDPPGLFELDGNTLDSGAAGTDWDALFGGAQPANLITFTGITADPAPQSIFTAGGSKDIRDVTAWKHKDGSVPDKDDITNAYAAAYNNPADVCLNGSGNAVLCTDPGAVGSPVHEEGDLIVYFGLDRFDNSGDAFAGFWFFQDDVALGTGGSFTGQHVARSATGPGDILVLVEYPQASGATPEIKVYEWDPADLDQDNVATNLDLLITQSNAECDGSGGKLACAITNLTDLASEPAWPYTPKDGSGLPFESFFEGGVNVTQLLGTTPCFAAFMAETRASRSETATLKDFVIDEFPVCGAEVTKACQPAINAAGDEATVSITGTASNTGGQSLFIKLEDSEAGTAFTAVCFDTTGVIGKCDGTDAVPADLTLGATATFTLGAGQEALYEGNYQVTGPFSSLLFTDTVTLSFFSNSGQTEPLGTATATANCEADVTGGLTIDKICDAAIGTGGVRLVAENGLILIEVGNIITVTNTGNEKLINVTVSDTEVPSLVIEGAASDMTCPATGSCTGSLEPLETVTFRQTYRPDTITGDPNDPSTVTLDNEATVVGEGALSGDPFTDSDGASCPLCPPHNGT